MPMRVLSLALPRPPNPLDPQPQPQPPACARRKCHHLSESEGEGRKLFGINCRFHDQTTIHAYIVPANLRGYPSVVGTKPKTPEHGVFRAMPCMPSACGGFGRQYALNKPATCTHRFHLAVASLVCPPWWVSFETSLIRLRDPTIKC